VALAVKKTPFRVGGLTNLNERRVQVYELVQELHSAGCSQRKIAKAVGISRNSVAFYINGDFESICQVKFWSRLDRYHDYIVKSLESGMSRTDVYNNCVLQGFQGKRTAAYDYMNKLIRNYDIDVSVYKSTSTDVVQRQKSLQGFDYVTRSGVMRCLWMNEDIQPAHREFLFKTYPDLVELDTSIREFRRIFHEKRMPLLYLFINRYKQSRINALSVFASGLEKDIEAVENAVGSDLSNGFVEGSVNKLKMTKRVMYGRCRRELLAAKMMYNVGTR